MELHGHFDPWLVTLSFIIAAVGSYVALRLAPSWAGRMATEEKVRIRGVLPSAVALGVTIWSMHFTGMAAFYIHGTAISYDWAPTILSLCVAVIFTAIGFATLTLLHQPFEALLLAGVPMGCGILAMHFPGMLAMSGDMRMHFDPPLVVAAGAIALVASIAALWMTTLEQRALSRMGSAVVMAIAICGMHYTGMLAAHFTGPTHSIEVPAPAVSAW